MPGLARSASDCGTSTSLQREDTTVVMIVIRTRGRKFRVCSKARAHSGVRFGNLAWTRRGKEKMRACKRLLTFRIC